jgi:hypothetical protein
VLVLGCGKVDMIVQPRAKPYQESDFFVDGQASRPLLAGTIARGQLHLDQAYYQGKLGDLLVDKIPARVDRALLERGQERFNIYCSPCHSRLGDGRGMIVQRGFPPPPSFHDQRLLDAPSGHYFNVITKGYGALQLSQHAVLGDVPAQERPRLDEEGAKR